MKARVVGILAILALGAPPAGAQGTDPSLAWGVFPGDLSELGPEGTRLEYQVNDPPGSFERYDTGFFSYKRFDVVPGTPTIRGALQLGINATRWTDPYPGRKNYEYLGKDSGTADAQTLRVKITAGNIDLDASLQASGTLRDPPRGPWLKAILDEMLAKIPRVPAADTGVEVFPHGSAKPCRVGLIPATPLLPARIVATRFPPGATVTFAVPGDAPALLKAGKATGKTVEVKADASGRAEASFQYAPANDAPLPGQLAVAVAITSGADRREAEVRVGLGLAFEKVKAVPGQKYAYSRETPYAFTLSVRSTFAKELNVPVYLRNALDSGVWGDAYLGLELQTTWINRPAEVQEDDVPYDGTVNVEASYEGPGESFLSANQEPWYTPAKFFYPAVVMRSMGNHVYEVTGHVAVLDRTTKRAIARVRNDDLVVGRGLVVLSAEAPETAIQSLACSLNATSRVQFVMLETAKKMPLGYGTAVETLTAGTGLVCGLLKEEYESAFLELANFLGGRYLDHLETPAVLEKLTPRQRDALKVARRSYDELNERKQEAELDRLK